MVDKFLECESVPKVYKVLGLMKPSNLYVRTELHSLAVTGMHSFAYIDS